MNIKSIISQIALNKPKCLLWILQELELHPHRKQRSDQSPQKVMSKIITGMQSWRKASTNASAGYFRLRYDLVVNALKGYLGNWSQERVQAMSCQLQRESFCVDTVEEVEAQATLVVYSLKGKFSMQSMQRCSKLSTPQHSTACRTTVTVLCTILSVSHVVVEEF